MMFGALLNTKPAALMLACPCGKTMPRHVFARRWPRPALVTWPRNSSLSPSVAARTPSVTACSAAFVSCAMILVRLPCKAAARRKLMRASYSKSKQDASHQPSARLVRRNSLRGNMSSWDVRQAHKERQCIQSDFCLAKRTRLHPGVSGLLARPIRLRPMRGDRPHRRRRSDPARSSIAAEKAFSIAYVLLISCTARQGRLLIGRIEIPCGSR